MRIGIVTTWFERGAAYVSRQYRDLLQQYDHDVFIFARGGEWYAKGDAEWDDPNVTWATKNDKIWTQIDHREFSTWLEKNRPDAVLFNEQTWLPPVLWAKESGALALAYVDYYKEDTVSSFALYDGLICNTKRHLSVFTWHQNVLYLPWGTDLALFSPQSLDAVDNVGPVFFHSGGMNPYRKGTDMVLFSFAQLKGPARLVVHLQRGLREAFPSNFSGLQQLIQKNKNIAILEGDVSAPGLYHLGDVYVYPSRLDGIGLTQAEALGCGLPLIVPDNPPMNEFIAEENGITIPIEKLWCRADGYYWPQCEVSLQALTKGMQMFVDKFSLLPSFKRQARNYAEKHLNWNDRGPAFNDWLQKLVQKKGNSTKPVNPEGFHSSAYWEERYRRNGNSGVGSYDRLADFKAGVINDFVTKHEIREAAEMGCGDGNQLSLFTVDKYIGIDVSETIIERLRQKFMHDGSKTFYTTFEPVDKKVELVLSLDVLYHLTEESTFTEYMDRLFSLSSRYVIIYSTNFNDSDHERKAPHVRHRKFTKWIAENRRDWICVDFIKNIYSPDLKTKKTGPVSACDFYIYEYRPKNVVQE